MNRKRPIPLLIAVPAALIALCVLLFVGLFEPAADEAWAGRFLQKNESRLPALIEESSGQYISRDNLFFSLNRLQSIDGRAENGVICFSFTSPNMEGFTALYYCPDGTVPEEARWWSPETGDWQTLPALSDVPPEGLRIDGLGANARGHIYFSLPAPDWLFIDANLPT